MRTRRRAAAKPVPQHEIPALSPPYLGPANNQGAPNNRPINRIVVHSTVSKCEPGGARNIARYFRTTDRPASAHYIIDPLETVQSVYDSVVAYHAPPNTHSLAFEMCDIPGPVPNDPPGSARWKAAKRAWRWRLPNQRRMLDRTARDVAQTSLAEDVPPVFLSPADLRAGKRGITTHAHVSKAWGQTTHWDPGFWPRRWFMRQVRFYRRELLAGRIQPR